jgi:hypothetical protein
LGRMWGDSWLPTEWNACMCVRERKEERERLLLVEDMHMKIRGYQLSGMCVCEREREKKRERDYYW